MYAIVWWGRDAKFRVMIMMLFFPFLISVSGRFHFPHHDSRSLHYLSQATDPPDSVQMLQSHFEAWKVRKLTNS